MEETKLHRGTLGLIQRFTQRRGVSKACFQAVTGEVIKRWGIEGMRIGTSDRFVRGRGELVRPLYDITLL